MDEAGTFEILSKKDEEISEANTQGAKNEWLIEREKV